MKKSLIAFLSVVYVFCFFIYAQDVAAQSPTEKTQNSAVPNTSNRITGDKQDKTTKKLPTMLLPKLINI